MNITAFHSSSPILHAIAALSWKGTLFALIVGLAILILRRRLSPAWRHGLWLLVLVRFAIPDLGTSPVSMSRWLAAPASAESPSTSISASPQAELLPAPQSPAPESALAETAATPEIPAAPVSAAKGVASPPVSPAAPWTFWQWLTFTWLSGAGAVIGTMVMLHLRMAHRVRRDRTDPSPSARAALRSACAQAQVKQMPALIVTGAVRAPALFGIVRPVILLPRELAGACDAASLNLILLHELAHRQRRDLWAQIAASLIIALHWFNPAAWWAARRLRAEAEMAADAWALRHTDAREAHRMGEVLLGLAGHAATGWVLWFGAATLLGISENKRDLRRRIEALMDVARGRRPWWAMGLAAFVVLSVTGLTKAPAEDARKDAARANPATVAGAHASDPALAHSLRDFRRVVVADHAFPVQRAAAEELAHYVGLISGVKLEVIPAGQLAADAPGLTFFVGDGAAARSAGEALAPWKTEEYLLRSVAKGLVLAGDDGNGDAWAASTRAGSMLAVYTLLDDHLGVHWFWPGEFGEHVPSNPGATLPALEVRQTPAFEIRSVQLGYPGGTYHTAAFNDAARKWARRARLGWVKSAVFGHSWFDAFNLRNKDSFNAHPEWFALVNGRRTPPQMCTTNPEVIARMVEYVLNGKEDIMNISPSDGGGFCECDRCRALDVPGVMSYDKVHIQLSDRIFTYANEVARRVREKNPAKGCGMFAYTYSNRPPVKIPKLEPNLYLSFVYQSAAQRDPENLREWRETVAGWQALGAKLVVREGWGNHYYFDLPFLHPRQIIANLSEAQRLGFVAAYGEGSKSFATMAPNYWALTRSMWKPEGEAAEVMPEFYQSAYGPVAKEMEAFFETYDRALDANWSKLDRNVDTSAIAYANIVGAWRKLIPREAVEEAEQHLKAAEARAPAGEYAGRVRFHRFGQDYARVMLDLLESYRQLAELGVPIDTFSSIVKERRDAPSERDSLLRRAYDLGEQREQMLLAHRDWAGPDEGLYAFTNDRNIRQWHTSVKKALGIDQASTVTKSSLGTK